MKRIILKNVSWLRKTIMLGLAIGTITSAIAQSVTINIPQGSTPRSSWNPWVYSFTDPLPAGATLTKTQLTFSGRDQGWGNTGGTAHFYVSDEHIGSAVLWHHTTYHTLRSEKCFTNYQYGNRNTFKMYFAGWPGWQGFFWGGTLTLFYEFIDPLELTSSSSTDVSCNGGSDGSIDLTVTGGREPVNVLWSNGATDTRLSGLSAGQYTVVITDKCGATVSQSFTISEPTALEVDAGENHMVFLGYSPTETAHLFGSVSGGTEPYSVEWTLVGGGFEGSGTSLIVSPTESSEYVLTVTDANGCVASDQVSVCVVDIAVPSKNGKGSKKVYMCHIPEDNPDNAHTISVSVNAVPDHLAHGDKLGPCGTPQSCDDSFKSGPDPESFMQRITSKDSYLNVYPNPTSGEVYVEFSLDEGVHTKITLIDIQGASHEVLYDNTAQHSEESQIMIDSQLLSTGIYIVRMQTSAGQLKTTKLIVN